MFVHLCLYARVYIQCFASVAALNNKDNKTKTYPYEKYFHVCVYMLNMLRFKGFEQHPWLHQQSVEYQIRRDSQLKTNEERNDHFFCGPNRHPVISERHCDSSYRGTLFCVITTVSIPNILTSHDFLNMTNLRQLFQLLMGEDIRQDTNFMYSFCLCVTACVAVLTISIDKLSARSYFRVKHLSNVVEIRNGGKHTHTYTQKKIHQLDGASIVYIT